MFSIDASSTGTGSISGNVLTVTGAGSIVLDANQAGNTNYNAAAQVLQTLVVAKANATVVVTPYNLTYDANHHTVTYTITGVGTDISAAGSSIDVSGTTHTNAGTYTGDTWTFAGGTNYNDATGTVDDNIAKADATVTVAGYSGTYDAAAHGATGTVVGVVGDLSAGGSGLTVGSSFTDAPGGTASWTFIGGANYNDQNGTALISIAKADATVTVAGYSGTYDAAAARRDGHGRRRGRRSLGRRQQRERGLELHGRPGRHGELDVHRRSELQRPEWHGVD